MIAFLPALVTTNFLSDGVRFSSLSMVYLFPWIVIVQGASARITLSLGRFRRTWLATALTVGPTATVCLTWSGVIPGGVAIIATLLLVGLLTAILTWVLPRMREISVTDHAIAVVGGAAFIWSVLAGGVTGAIYIIQDSPPQAERIEVQTRKGAFLKTRPIERPDSLSEDPLEERNQLLSEITNIPYVRVSERNLVERDISYLRFVDQYYEKVGVEPRWVPDRGTFVPLEPFSNADSVLAVSNLPTEEEPLVVHAARAIGMESHRAWRRHKRTMQRPREIKDTAILAAYADKNTDSLSVTFRYATDRSVFVEPREDAEGQRIIDVEIRVRRDGRTYEVPLSASAPGGIARIWDPRPGDIIELTGRPIEGDAATDSINQKVYTLTYPSDP